MGTFDAIDKFFEDAQALIGDRFAEARLDPDGAPRVTVIDLSERDVAAITAVAERLGVSDQVRIERADPAALNTWERLRHDLIRLRDVRPSVLTEYPMPNRGYRRPPVEIDVAMHAEATAAALHQAYGDFVSLTVGTLPYPLRAKSSDHSDAPRLDDRHDIVDPDELDVAMDGRLSIPSGQTMTHGLLLTNRSDHDITLHTNGHLYACIVDNGAVVGGSEGHHQPLVRYTVKPAQTIRVPLVVATTSRRTELGYTLPAGTWHLTAPMSLSDGRLLTTPTLELTITD